MLKKALKVSLYVNPIFFIGGVIAELYHDVPILLITMLVTSVGISCLVSISGWIFKRTLEEFFSGDFIKTVERDYHRCKSMFRLFAFVTFRGSATTS